MSFKTKYFGNNLRRNYGKISLDLPELDLLELQKKSYQMFLEKGINKVLLDTFPIIYQKTDLKVTIEFRDYFLKQHKTLSEVTRDESGTYDQLLYVSFSLKVDKKNCILLIEDDKSPTIELLEKYLLADFNLKKIKLVNQFEKEGKEYFLFTDFSNTEVKVSEFTVIVSERSAKELVFEIYYQLDDRILFTPLPLITHKGTFVINGNEKVVVSQSVRSAGIYYKFEIDVKNKVKTLTCDLIPARGLWLDFSTVNKSVLKKNDESNLSVIQLKIEKSNKVYFTTFLTALGISEGNILELLSDNQLLLNTYKLDPIRETSKAAKEIVKKITKTESVKEDTAKLFFKDYFFDNTRYDLSVAGRYKLNRKLSILSRVKERVLAEDITFNGRVLLTKGTLLTEDSLQQLNQAIELGACRREIKVSDFADSHLNLVKVYSNDGSTLIHVLGNEGNDDIKNITVGDILSSLSYFLNLSDGIGETDDIDDLGNKLVKTVGDLLQNQFRIGTLRIAKNIREKLLTTKDSSLKLNLLVNSKPLSAVINEFFNLSEFCQFMDETNLLSEMSHKRKITALGHGGLAKEQAGLDIRDVKDTDLCRVCPIETPEGPNIGLIKNLSIYARINEYGFIEAPYRKVVNSVATDSLIYLTALEEQQYCIGQADIRFDENNKIISDRVIARFQGKNIVVPPEELDYMLVSPMQVFSVATALIPFLGNDASFRASMGANMGRQAVPLLNPSAPLIGTGMEYLIARDSGMSVVAPSEGVIEYVDSEKIEFRDINDKKHTFELISFQRSNQNTAIIQHPLVNIGEKVHRGKILADGPGMDNGELALGQNLLVAIMVWKGYNYEDSIIVSERLIKDDVFTSLHIRECIVEVRKVKSGGYEEITREIPNVSQSALRYLDENGIVMKGHKVKAGDILVGKITPRLQVFSTPADKLLEGIFGVKARSVKDTSLRVLNGEEGIVHSVQRFSKKYGHQLPVDVQEIVKIYIVQRRHLNEGDKLSGRHGDKGVVSRIVPIEDMPHLPDGTPIDVILNPLGIPSRMNIGQVLELHLGLAAKKLDIKIATPVFDGLTSSEIDDIMQEAQISNLGCTTIIEGMDGEVSSKPISVGIKYLSKLWHMVEGKFNARDVGQYSVITQQPPGGKALKGGQRLGEMEIWALEAWGAAFFLQESLTLRSDDIEGRAKTYAALVKGKAVPNPVMSESFNVLAREVEGLGLGISLTENNQETSDNTEESK